MIALGLLLAQVAFAHPDNDPPPSSGDCAVHLDAEEGRNAAFYLEQMSKPRPVDGLYNELDLLGFLLPKRAVPIAFRSPPTESDLAAVDGVRFTMHKAQDHWDSTYVRMKYLAGEEVVRQIEFKNWKDRGLPSEARANRTAEGWDVTTSALFDEGVPHHHLRLRYSPAGRLMLLTVTTRASSTVEVVDMVPHAPRDAR